MQKIAMEKFKELPVTYSLMFISTVVFLISLIAPKLEVSIYVAGALHDYEIFVEGQVYRFISSMFIHSGAMHIVMNMLSLYMVGQILEKLFRPLTYLSIYFVTGIFGSLLFLYINTDGQAVGASGAIFGIFGALAGFAWVHRKTMHDEFMRFIQSFGMILLINFALGLAIPEIAMSAHIGGLITGIISGIIMAKYPNYLWAYLLVSFTLIFLSYNYIASLYATSFLLH
jgi:rhomboid protease GluP